jgi:hypothetical protein
MFMIRQLTGHACACTAVQLHALGVPAGHFTHIMFDEAGQAGGHHWLCALPIGAKTQDSCSIYIHRLLP